MEKDILKNLFCIPCQLQFNGKSVHNQHLSLVHKHNSDLKRKDNQRNISYDFENCDEKVVINHKLKEHDENKPFTCDICNATFTRKDSLKRHSVSVHEGKKPLKPFKCDICSAAFPAKSKLKTHFAEAHEGKKPIKCDICDATFFSKRFFEDTCSLSS